MRWLSMITLEAEDNSFRRITTVHPGSCSKIRSVVEMRLRNLRTKVRLLRIGFDFDFRLWCSVKIGESLGGPNNWDLNYEINSS